eukprot:PhM_4_TR16766/c0_g2_i1/m.75046
MHREGLVGQGGFEQLVCRRAGGDELDVERVFDLAVGHDDGDAGARQKAELDAGERCVCNGIRHADGAEVDAGLVHNNRPREGLLQANEHVGAQLVLSGQWRETTVEQRHEQRRGLVDRHSRQRRRELDLPVIHNRVEDTAVEVGGRALVPERLEERGHGQTQRGARAGARRGRLERRREGEHAGAGGVQVASEALHAVNDELALRVAHAGHEGGLRHRGEGDSIAGARRVGRRAGGPARHGDLYADVERLADDRHVHRGLHLDLEGEHLEQQTRGGAERGLEVARNARRRDAGAGSGDRQEDRLRSRDVVRGLWGEHDREETGVIGVAHGLGLVDGRGRGDDGGEHGGIHCGDARDTARLEHRRCEPRWGRRADPLVTDQLHAKRQTAAHVGLSDDGSVRADGVLCGAGPRHHGVAVRHLELREHTAAGAALQEAGRKAAAEACRLGEHVELDHVVALRVVRRSGQEREGCGAARVEHLDGGVGVDELGALLVEGGRLRRRHLRGLPAVEQALDAGGRVEERLAGREDKLDHKATLADLGLGQHAGRAAARRRELHRKETLSGRDRDRGVRRRQSEAVRADCAVGNSDLHSLVLRAVVVGVVHRNHEARRQGGVRELVVGAVKSLGAEHTTDAAVRHGVARGVVAAARGIARAPGGARLLVRALARGEITDVVLALRARHAGRERVGAEEAAGLRADVRLRGATRAERLEGQTGQGVRLELVTDDVVRDLHTGADLLLRHNRRRHLERALGLLDCDLRAADDREHLATAQDIRRRDGRDRQVLVLHQRVVGVGHQHTVHHVLGEVRHRAVGGLEHVGLVGGEAVRVARRGRGRDGDGVEQRRDGGGLEDVAAGGRRRQVPAHEDVGAGGLSDTHVGVRDLLHEERG